MEFYKIWQTRSGLIGVNKLSLGDLVMANITVVLLYTFIIALIGLILPTLLILLYIGWMITHDSGDGYDGRGSEQRLVVNIITIVATILFLIDFYTGFMVFYIIGKQFTAENYDKIAIFNLTIALLSIVYFFVGHEIYRVASSWIVRIIVFISFSLFISFKVLNPISTYLIKNVIIQYSDEESQEFRIKHHNDSY